MGAGHSGIDVDTLTRLADEVCQLHRLGVQVGMVIGGGNLFRGAALAKAGMDRVTGDHMGMLATVMNALAMQETLKRMDVPARVLSAWPIEAVCETYTQRRAVHHLEQGRVALFAAGTGNPFFTTDTAASLRAIETQADVMLKATKVDGIYSSDPLQDPQAVFYPRLTYDEALAQKLNVMDATALILCRDHRMKLQVFNIHRHGDLVRVVCGADLGTTVVPE